MTGSGTMTGSGGGSSEGQERSAGLLATHGKGAAASIAAAALWAILAWRSPSSTHHFAPLVVAGLWGFTARYDTARYNTARPSTADRLIMATGGFVATASTQVVLAVADKLRGPPLLSAVPVLVELASMAIIGAIFGGQLWRLLDRRLAINPESD